MLSSKVRCDVKVDPNADDVWYKNYKPDVNLTTDDMLREAKKLEKRGHAVNLKLVYPWEWWQCWFEACDGYRYRYYDARRNHGVLCTCCENARYSARSYVDSSKLNPPFNVVKNLCDGCRASKCQHPCEELVAAVKARQKRKLTLPRRINVITTQEVIDLKLQSEVT